MKIIISSSRQALSFLERISSPSKHDISYFLFFAVLEIHDILVDQDPRIRTSDE
jgi:hypothetical protein